jgi:predicted small integral membrane protein
VIARYTKIAMTLCLGAFAFIVTFNNLTDYAANWPFVVHVMSMDTTFRGSATAWRAVHQPSIWRTGYALIIAGEAVTAGLMIAAAVRMFAARHAPARAFNRAKSWLHLAALAGFLVWFAAFMVVGGEWFQMWQSPAWNGQQAAFRFYVTILLVLIYVMQPDGEGGG